MAEAQAHAGAGRHAEAERVLRAIVAAVPREAPPWRALAVACWVQGRTDDAIAAMREAAARDPSYAEAPNDLGVMLARAGRFDESVAAFSQAAAARPRWAEPLVNLGNAHRNAGRLDEAVDAYRRAVALEPARAHLHHALGSTLGRAGFREQARAHYLEALRLDPRDAAAHSGLLYLTSLSPGNDARVLRAEHVWWDRLHGRGLAPAAPHANAREPERRLRIGYVSADFRAHAVAQFLLPIYEAHDRARVAVVSYSDVETPDAVTSRFRALSDEWRELGGLSDAAVAERVRDDRIDVLVDLGGHTTGTRLRVFTERPAPLQMSYLGYPCTTGLAAMTHRITDDVLDPAGVEGDYTEALLRLSGAWTCWRPPEAAPAVAPPPVAGSGVFTFGSLANVLKLNDAVLDQWAEILRAAPGSRLRLRRNTLTGRARQDVLRRFAARGVAPERLDVATNAEGDHLVEYASLDLSLDTQPWSGHTITCESLWMGVPVATLRGPLPTGRMAASVLAAAGLDEFVAETPAALVELAVGFARDPRRLVELRSTLRDRVASSPLCDAPSFTRRFEAALRDAWRAWCKSQ